MGVGGNSVNVSVYILLFWKRCENVSDINWSTTVVFVLSVGGIHSGTPNFDMGGWPLSE